MLIAHKNHQSLESCRLCGGNVKCVQPVGFFSILRDKRDDKQNDGQ